MIENEIFSRLPLKFHNAYFRNIATSHFDGWKNPPEHGLKSAVCKFIAGEVLVSFVPGWQLYDYHLLIRLQTKETFVLIFPMPGIYLFLHGFSLLKQNFDHTFASGFLSKRLTGKCFTLTALNIISHLKRRHPWKVSHLTSNVLGKEESPCRDVCVIFEQKDNL